MTDQIKISIIIVNFNTLIYLEKCLESLIKNNSGGNKIEIIVVDNASDDNKISLLPKKFPSIKLIMNKKNLGFAKANNIAVKKAAGDYILFLNPDTIIPPGTIKIMTDFMEKNKDVSVSTCKVELLNGQIDDACHRGFPTPLRSIFYFTGLSKIFPKSLFFNGYHLGYKNMDRDHEIDSCTGAFMLVRRQSGEKVGWLDEDYFWYGEDLDFCFKIKETGGKIYYVPHAKIIHYKGVSSGIKKHSKKLSTASSQTRLLATRARFAVMRTFYNKHYSKKYPYVVTYLVMSFISIKEFLTLLKFRISE